MNNIPLVSAIVPCFNHEKYIEQTILSIVNQSYKNIQLIVIDDGSKDNSQRIIKELSEKYSFEYAFQENSGVSRAINKALTQFAKGKYISLCASDDYWELTKIEKQVKFLEENPQYGVCYGKNIVFNEKGIIHKEKGYNKSGWLFDDIITGKFWALNFLFKKEVFDTVGLYSVDTWVEDFDMTLRMAKKFQFGYIDEFLLYYRIHPTQHSTNNPKRIELGNEGHRKILELYKDEPIYKKAIREWNLRWFRSYTDVNKKKALEILPKIWFLFHRKHLYIGLIKLLVK